MGECEATCKALWMAMGLLKALYKWFLSGILCDSHRLTEYALIQEKKTWNEARDFCRKNYIDLATVQTDEEWSKLNELRANYRSNTWIGLYDDVNSWRWSFQNECLEYARWDEDKPKNKRGNQYCVMLHSSGYWSANDCNLKCLCSRRFFFFCKSPRKYFYFRAFSQKQS
uniref:C-type lectin domain-containing protein n=2 Tax=Cyprinus carpio TaxID=7962 RepID=A0A8C1EZV1_CYPCA